MAPPRSADSCRSAPRWPSADSSPNPAFSLLGFLVAWQIFPHFASPFFDALLKVVHPADDYL
jgi:hypothetical protein